MGRAGAVERGFRLSNAEQYELTWFHVNAEAECNGLQGQRYETVSADTSIDKLFAQERLVGLGRGNTLDRYQRMRLIAQQMTLMEGAPGAGIVHWGYLRLVYGPLRAQDAPMHDYFDHSIAPLARATPTALRRAELRWPHWHCERHEDRYRAVYELVRRERGAFASIDVMMRQIPDDARAAGELDAVLNEVLGGACDRAVAADRQMGKPLNPSDEKMLRDVGRQADEMLTAAGLAYQAAAEKVDEAIDEAHGRGKREADAEEDRLAARESETRIRDISPVLDVDAGLLRDWYWGEDDEDAA